MGLVSAPLFISERGPWHLCLCHSIYTEDLIIMRTEEGTVSGQRGDLAQRIAAGRKFN